MFLDFIRKPSLKHGAVKGCQALHTYRSRTPASNAVTPASWCHLDVLTPPKVTSQHRTPSKDSPPSAIGRQVGRWRYECILYEQRMRETTDQHGGLQNKWKTRTVTSSGVRGAQEAPHSRSSKRCRLESTHPSHPVPDLHIESTRLREGVLTWG